MPFSNSRRSGAARAIILEPSPAKIIAAGFARWNHDFRNVSPANRVITLWSLMESKMKLLAATAISVLALAAAVPALAGDPTQTANNTAKADQAIPGDQNLTNSDQTALNHRNTQAALNNQESVDQSGVTPGGQSGNQDLQSQNQTALNDQNAGQDQDDSQASGQTGMNGQMALNDQNNGTSAEDQATVDTGAIARNDAVDPNVQRMNRAAQEKAGQMDNDQAEAGKLNPDNITPPTEE